MALHRYSSFAPGTVFLRSGEDKHFWVVLSDPAKDKDRVLVVNWTTHADYKEQTCILEPGEHRCLTRRCCVYYTGASIEKLDSLQYAELCNNITVFNEPLAAEILQRIRDGAAKSDNILKAGPTLLREQGFIT
jgi:hypothetical protein